MAGNNYKTVWSYTENNGSAFNEVWYRSASSMAAASTFPDALINLRLQMLDDLNILQSIRVTDLAGGLPTTIVQVRKPGLNAAAAGPLPAGAAIVCRLASATGGHRLYWQRGNCESDYARDATTGIDKINPAWKTIFDAFMAAMATNNFGVRTLVKANPNGSDYFQITNIDGQTTPGKTILTANGTPVLNPFNRIIITQVDPKDYPAINGHFTLLNVVGNKFTIPYTTPMNNVFPVTSGRFRKETYNDIAVFTPALCAFDHLGTRSTRGPLTHSRGARRAQRLRRLA